MAVEKQKPVTDEIASAATDIDMFQGWLPVMENPDRVLNLEAGGDITVYDNIGRDPRVASGLRTRAKAVTGREWQIVPFSQEPIDLQVAEYVEKVLLNCPYDRARRSILRGGVLKGFAVAEAMWDYSEGDTFLADIRYRHQRRFRFSPEGALHLLTIDNPYPGRNVTTTAEGLPLRKFQVFTFGDEVTTPYGVGLGQELYWPWWFKKNGIKFWLMFADKFAGPTAAGEYPVGTPPEKQRELLAAAQAIHSNSAIVYPAGMNLRLIEAARSGAITCYSELCAFMNEEMTIAILGQTATTTGKPGALGGSDEQADVRSDYLKDDADSLCEAQNDRAHGIIPWLVDYQFPGLKRYPKVWIKTESEQDGKTLAERDKSLAESLDKGGRYRLSKSYYVRQHGMEEDDLEELTPSDNSEKSDKSEVSEKSEKSDKSDPAFSECPHCRGLSFAEGDAPDPAEAISLQAHQAADGSGLVAAIRKHLEEARDLPSALDTFTQLRRELDLAPVVEALARATIVADLTGRFEVRNEVAAQEAFHFAEGTALPFDEALQFFRQKLDIKTETWTELWKDGHSRAFTVAGAMRDDMLGDFRDAIAAALQDGTTHAAFLQEFDAIVARYGWSYNGSRGWRSRVIYDTNIRTAYNAGRWKQLTDPDLVALNPYLEYRHGDSRHPRPLHQSWDGIVLPAGDPWWNTHYTPNGWGCKCRVLSVGPRDLERMGKKGPDTAPDDGTYEWLDKKTGELHDIPNGIDPGWDYNPGKAWLNPATGKREAL